jgi:release factor glutamine methyltransferase
MSSSETWTIGRLLEWTTEFLKSRGSETPRLDAEVLLAHARGCQRIELYTAFDEVPPDAVRTAFRDLVRRRAEGTPVAYLVGRREFYSLAFRVTPDVLIPRPETEFLIISVLDLARARPAESEPPVIADVGTGSGIIAVTLAKHLPGSRVTALDISPAALAVAASNAADHGVRDRIELVESDLLSAVPPVPGFDFVVSNPPYVTSAEMEQLAPSVRDFEPRLALEAGPRGVEVIERLVPQAAQRLQPGGYLLLEISPMLEPAVRELLAADGRFELLSTRKDLAGLARVISARRRSKASVASTPIGIASHPS